MIREAKTSDLDAVSAVHIKCFPDSFSTALGAFKPKFLGEGYLLSRFYSEYMKANPELFLVAENDSGEIVGFCMGYYCEKNDYIKRYFLNNKINIALRILTLLLRGNKQAWKKVAGVLKKGDPFETINYEIADIDECKKGDLLSICVLPEYRGSGIAQQLIEKYHAVLKKSGRQVCILTVATDNGRGIAFYERNGYIPFREAAGTARTYAKILNEDKKHSYQT